MYFMYYFNIHQQNENTIVNIKQTFRLFVLSLLCYYIWAGKENNKINRRNEMYA